MIALLPLLVSLAGEYGPALTKMLLGQKAGDVVGSVIKAAKDIFGTDDPAAIEAAVKDDPSLVALYIERVKAETEQFKAELEDVKDARKQTVTLVQSGSIIAWGAPVVSMIVVVGFVIMLGLWLFHPPSDNQAVLSVFTIMIGALASAFGATVQYWLGSSAGSARKDDTLATALVSAQGNTSAAIAKPAIK